MVIKDPDGAVYIGGVPMVDQGRKGYCACAATIRLLRAYWMEHEALIIRYLWFNKII